MYGLSRSSNSYNIKLPAENRHKGFLCSFFFVFFEINTSTVDWIANGDVCVCVCVFYTLYWRCCCTERTCATTSSALVYPSSRNSTSPFFIATKQGSLPTSNRDETDGQRLVSIANMCKSRPKACDTAANSFFCNLQGPQLTAMKLIKTNSSWKLSIISSTLRN